MARQGELNIAFRQYFSAPVCRIVTEQDLEHSFSSLKCLTQVGVVGEGRSSAVFHAGQCNGVVSPVQNAVAVHQHLPSHAVFPDDETVHIGNPVKFGFPSGVSAIVVVSQDGEHSVFCTEL